MPKLQKPSGSLNLVYLGKKVICAGFLWFLILLTLVQILSTN